MGVIRGPIQVPYGRRGVSGPIEGTAGGEWPFTKCLECNGWIDPNTGEHAEVLTLEEALKRTEKDSNGE